MAGPSRDDKLRKEREAQRRLAAAGIQVPPKKKGTGPRTIVFTVLGVAVVAGLVAWAMSAMSGGGVEPTYTASRDGGVVTAGAGPVQVDVYQDYLCMHCERFHTHFGDEITTAILENKITARFHPVAILDDLSQPPGYSTRAAEAALCSADVGFFPKYNAALYEQQPREGGAGLSDDDLVAIGTDLGAPPDFATCVRGDQHKDDVANVTDKATNDDELATEGRFGTPTVTVNGQKANLNDSGWLQNVIGG